MSLLTINAGSSSLKLAIYETKALKQKTVLVRLDGRVWWNPARRVYELQTGNLHLETTDKSGSSPGKSWRNSKRIALGSFSASLAAH